MYVKKDQHVDMLHVGLHPHAITLFNVPLFPQHIKVSSV